MYADGKEGDYGSFKGGREFIAVRSEFPSFGARGGVLSVDIFGFSSTEVCLPQDHTAVHDDHFLSDVGHSTAS